MWAYFFTSADPCQPCLLVNSNAWVRRATEDVTVVSPLDLVPRVVPPLLLLLLLLMAPNRSPGPICPDSKLFRKRHQNGMQVVVTPTHWMTWTMTVGIHMSNIGVDDSMARLK
ncbi:hypothetical protein HG530_000465 [Fusarium avenaceum]|nr:hypothetical protein HG530_000465 [Fusarium avenaceum]